MIDEELKTYNFRDGDDEELWYIYEVSSDDVIAYVDRGDVGKLALVIRSLEAMKRLSELKSIL